MTSDTLNPYVGLRPFREDENLLFFGRDKQTLELLQRLHHHRFVAVVGGSGSGKSSLIRAGLIPALKGGYLVEDSSQWLIATMKPGSNPMYNLAQTILQQIEPTPSDEAILELVLQIKRQGTKAVTNLLAPIQNKKNTNFFLLVDQFEELFRFSMNQRRADKKAQAIDFVNLILNLSQQNTVNFYVVLTMRSDFIGDCAKFRNLPEAMNESQYLVPRITRQQLKKIIEGPARLFGGKVNPALTTRLVNDLQKVQDELPLLQHAMMRIWDHEVNLDKSGELDLEDYSAIGGIEEALSIHADEAFKDVESADKHIVEEMFKALTEIDENGRKIRRPLLLSDLKILTGASEDKLMNIIQNFIGKNRSFLIVEKKGEGGDRMIDISHESLIRQWKLLEDWVVEEEINASSYKQLMEACEANKAGKRDYLTGTELQLALEWKERFKPTAVWANRYRPGFEDSWKYLENSKNERERLQNIALRKARVKRNTILGTLAVLAILLITTLFFYNSTRKQKEEANNKNRALEMHFNATVLASKDPTSALRLEQEALKLYDYPAFRKLAMEIIINKPLYWVSVNDTSEVTAIDVSPSGKYVLMGTNEGRISLWDKKGKLIHRSTGHEDAVTSIKFLQDESGYLSSGRDLTLNRWNSDGEMIAQVKGLGQPIKNIQISVDGKIAVSDTGGWIHYLDAALESNFTFRAHMREVAALAFSPDGQQLLTGSKDNSAKLWNLDGKLIQEFEGHRGEIYAVAFSPSDDLILTGSWDSHARLWDLDGEVKAELKGHFGAILSLAFSADGQQILTGSFDNAMRLWDLEGDILYDFVGHQSEVKKVYFTNNGHTVMSGSRDGTLRVWNYDSAKNLAFVDEKANRSVQFTPNDSTFLIGTQGRATIYKMNGELHKVLPCPGTGMVFSAVYGPNGKNIITGSQDGTIRKWTGHEEPDWSKKMVEIEKREAVRAIAFAPDGNSFVTGSWDYMLRLWDLEGNLLNEFRHDKGITSVAFSNDGKSVVAGTFGRSLIWNLETNRVDEIKEPSQRFVNGVAFTPDDKLILTGSQDNGARLWNLNGELIKEFKGPRGAVRSVAISHDGQRIITGTDGGTARLWDIDANILAEYQYDRGTVFSVAFAEDDRSFLMGSGDMIYHLKIIDLEKFFTETSFEQLNDRQRKLYKILD